MVCNLKWGFVREVHLGIMPEVAECSTGYCKQLVRLIRFVLNNNHIAEKKALCIVTNMYPAHMVNVLRREKFRKKRKHVLVVFPRRKDARKQARGK